MVRYLLGHRIAVVMAFLALVILGCITYAALPVSLLPDIAIPHITVRVNAADITARELENTAVAPLRRQLMQVGGLSEITSRTRDGSAVIALTMDYGVNTSLAFIEVNEKIDAAMSMLPKAVGRPKAAKASATDIPVLYLQMSPRSGSDADFAAMAPAVDNVVRRLEQQPEIAMVDVTGMPGRMLRVIPDQKKMAQVGVTTEEIEEALAVSNIESGSMTVRDGYYEYDVHVANQLRTPEDVEQLRLLHGGRVMRLSDFADVELTTLAPDGYSLHNGRRAATLAIIKHGEESVGDMQRALRSTIDHFAEQYPDIEFAETRSQTALLDFSISNLEQNLMLGLLLVFVVCALFMKGVRPSLVIGLSMVVGVVLTFLLFYLFRVSVNIISMSGLILAVGMMIDNSVIVTENIAQYRQRGYMLADACAAGTTEMITPMLSSSLTTVAVFVPLVFMSGIAGAIFADQAFSITAGLAASYAVAITLLPVLYYVFYKRKRSATAEPQPSATEPRSALYDRCMDFCLAHSRLFIVLTLATVPLCALLFALIRQERMPQLDTDETLAQIDWNENISLDENRRRVTVLADSAAAALSSAFVGPQDFLLATANELSSTEAELYFKTASADDIEPLRSRIARSVTSCYPKATVAFSNTENIFERIFASNEADIEARLHTRSHAEATATSYDSLRRRLAAATGQELAPIPMRGQVDIAADRQLLALYGVDFAEVRRALATPLRGIAATTMRSFSEYTPVRLEAGSKPTIEQLLLTATVRSRPDSAGLRHQLPLRSLVSVSRSQGLKTITAGAAGEYVPVGFSTEHADAASLMATVRSEVRSADGDFDVDFAGTHFSNARMMSELLVILAVALMLMYFILCAQFESFLQPLIVLMEIPVDACFALLALMVCGQSLNLMSAIGIIVTCGIVVNDSILKLDAINTLRRGGMPLHQAIHTAGRRRLRPIIMTSLTTIFAMVPVLFTSDMGSELQRPLAIAMIGSMAVGTLVSIFIIPLFYALIYRKHAEK